MSSSTTGPGSVCSNSGRGETPRRELILPFSRGRLCAALPNRGRDNRHHSCLARAGRPAVMAMTGSARRPTEASRRDCIVARHLIASRARAAYVGVPAPTFESQGSDADSVRICQVRGSIRGWPVGPPSYGPGLGGAWGLAFRARDNASCQPSRKRRVWQGPRQQERSLFFSPGPPTSGRRCSASGRRRRSYPWPSSKSVASARPQLVLNLVCALGPQHIDFLRLRSPGSNLGHPAYAAKWPVVPRYAAKLPPSMGLDIPARQRISLTAQCFPASIGHGRRYMRHLSRRILGLESMLSK